jgi:hypothetical protein
VLYPVVRSNGDVMGVVLLRVHVAGQVFDHADGDGAWCRRSTTESRCQVFMPLPQLLGPGSDINLDRNMGTAARLTFINQIISTVQRI